MRVVMSRVFQFQLWFSILCWMALAFAAARSLRNLWVGLLAFAIVLLFGANLETGLWDSLLLTESVSISLFVLLLAMWIGWFSISSAPGTAPSRRFTWLAMVLVSVLYAFTRDSNLYFLLICARGFHPGPHHPENRPKPSGFMQPPCSSWPFCIPPR